MAKDKKSFLLYSDLIYTVRKMKKEDAGELFQHLLAYVNDENPTTENMIVELTFEPIKQQLKRDLKKFEEVKRKRSKAGKKSAEARARKKQNSTSVKSVEQASTNSTDNDNESDNVNDNVILLEKETKEAYDLWIKYRKEIKKPIKSETTIQKLKEKIKEEGAVKSLLVINHSIENQYQGLFWDKHQNLEKEKSFDKKEKDNEQPKINRQTAATIESNARGW